MIPICSLNWLVTKNLTILWSNFQETLRSISLLCEVSLLSYNSFWNHLQINFEGIVIWKVDCTSVFPNSRDGQFWVEGLLHHPLSHCFALCKASKPQPKAFLCSMLGRDFLLWLVTTGHDMLLVGMHCSNSALFTFTDRPNPAQSWSKPKLIESCWR